MRALDAIGGRSLPDVWHTRLTTSHRVRRQLPSSVPRLMDTFSKKPELAPHLASPECLFRFCRMVGACLYSTTLARIVDGGQIARIAGFLGADAWRFGIDNPVGEDAIACPPGKIAAGIFDTGVTSVRSYLAEHLADLVDDIGIAAGIEWGSLQSTIDPALERAAVETVLAKAGSEAHGR